jgi:hypothetical protein
MPKPTNDAYKLIVTRLEASRPKSDKSSWLIKTKLAKKVNAAPSTALIDINDIFLNIKAPAFKGLTNVEDENHNSRNCNSDKLALIKSMRFLGS